MKLAIALAVGITALVASGSQLERPRAAETVEALSFPQIQFAKLLSSGFSNALSNYYLFRTVNYFGRQYRGSHDYRWLGHMCQVIVTLNPHDDRVTSFCASMLSWEANEPSKSVAVLSQALLKRPESWFLWYQRGFIRYFFHKDTPGAIEDLRTASLLPDCHPLVKQLVTKLMSGVHGKDEARLFLELLIRRSQNPIEREALIQRYRALTYESN